MRPILRGTELPRRPLPKQAIVAATVLVAALAASEVAAQQPATRPPPRSSSQFTLRREEAGGADASIARSRARAGDCAGALPFFDAAVRSTIEPTLRRDRGLCHEKLDHPHPAVEDYRAYLVARPDAPDADQIRERLARLEDQLGVGGPSAAPKEDEPDRATASGGASARLSLGEGGMSASASTSGKGQKDDEPIGPREGEPTRSYDYYAQEEKLEDMADRSPLRDGKGFILGPYVHVPRIYLGENRDDQVGYAVGGALRYSGSASTTGLAEIGYAGIGTQGEASAKSGFMTFLGIEGRFPVAKYSGDHILIGAGGGYERLERSGSRVVSDYFLARARVGFRHVFGPTLGFEMLVDGGPGYIKPEDADGRLNFLVQGSFALLIGF